MRTLLLPPACLALLLLAQCHRADPGPARPEDQLPPATQTGAGTFGCLLNGQPWIPAGYDGHPNFVLTYDAGYAGGRCKSSATAIPAAAPFKVSFSAVQTSSKQEAMYPLLLVPLV